jgi:inhibitor of cysteine peptidase
MKIETALCVIALGALLASPIVLAADGPTPWTCPMHPQVKAAEPGKCSTCRMDLVYAPVRPETVGEPIGGVIQDETLRKHAPANGYIDTYDRFAALLKAWNIDDPPYVDFRNDIVLVQTVDGPNRVRIRTKFDETNGNLQVLGAATRMAGPGFGWAMQVMSKDGIKQINGKPVEFAELGAPVVLISAVDAGKTRQANVGQVIAIDLTGNPTTGYGWVVDTIDGQAVRQANPVIFHETKKDIPPAQAGERKVVGAGGTFHATFQAVKEGKATVKLAYRRPWEKDKDPAKAFTVTIDVQPAKATAAVLAIGMVDGEGAYTLAGKTYTDLEKLLAALKARKKAGAQQLLLNAGKDVPKTAIADAVNIGRAAGFGDIGMQGKATEKTQAPSE